MVILMAMGALFGAGVFLAGLAVFGRPAPSLAYRLALIEAAQPRQARGANAIVAPGAGFLTRLAGVIVGRLNLGSRLVNDALAQDLAMLGMDRNAYTVRKVTTAVVALLIGPPLLLTLADLVGAPLLGGAYVALLVAGMLLVLPDRRVRQAAARRRTDFTTSFASYLDLVALRATADSGLHEALRDAAVVGDGPGWERLRLALQSARLRGAAPATGLHRLGAELDVPELVDLAGQLHGVVDTGAQVSATLSEKARALRSRERLQAAGLAAERSVSKVMGQICLAAGYILLLLYPPLMGALRF